MEILGFKSQLQQIVSDVGFSSVGITDPSKVDQSIKEKFIDFIKNDWNAGMDWLEKRTNERVAPEHLWPSVKSILVFTDDYTPVDDPLKKLMDKELSNLSVFATKRDYHKVVKSKLKVVASWVKKKLDCDLKIFVDTAPVMEKPLAQLSGLGWQGKHTNLVSRDMGNWFFIGVMYIDKSLPVDEPEEDTAENLAYQRYRMQNKKKGMDDDEAEAKSKAIIDKLKGVLKNDVENKLTSGSATSEQQPQNGLGNLGNLVQRLGMAAQKRNAAAAPPAGVGQGLIDIPANDFQI